MNSVGDFPKVVRGHALKCPSITFSQNIRYRLETRKMID